MSVLHVTTATFNSVSGRVGINGFSQIPNNSFMYKNFAKGISSYAAGTFEFQSIIDANGYPNQGSLTTTMALSLSHPSANYNGGWRIDWLGKAKMSLAPSGGVTVTADPSGVTTGSPGTVTIDGGGSSVTRTHVDFTFVTPGSSVLLPLNLIALGNFTGFSDLRLYRTTAPYAGDGAALDAGVITEIFNEDFLDDIRAINPPYIRGMDWQGTNNSYQSSTTYNKPLNYISYAAPHWLPNMWAGVPATADSGQTYTVGAAPADPVDAYVHGETIQVKFTTANLASPTLNKNGRGAKQIKRYLDVNFSTGAVASLSAAVITVNSFHTIVYDAIADAFMILSGGHTTSTPMQVQIALCNKLGIDPWVCVHAMFNDASIVAAFTYIRDNLRSDLNCYWEYSNEVWNTGSAFMSTRMAVVWGGSTGGLGFTGSSLQNQHSWYGYRFCQISNLIVPVWAATRSASQLRGLLMQQNADHSVGAPTKTYRYEGSNLGAWGFNTAPNRPIDKAYGIGDAVYTSGGVIRGPFGYTTGYSAGDLTALTTAADNYASGTPALMTSALDWVQTDHRSGTKNGSAGRSIVNILGVNCADIDAWANTYGVEHIMYEANYEAEAPTASECTTIGISTAYVTTIQNLINAYKNNSRFYDDMTYTYGMFFALAKAKYYSCYSYSDSSGAWSLGSVSLYGPKWKSRDALVDYNN